MGLGVAFAAMFIYTAWISSVQNYNRFLKKSSRVDLDFNFLSKSLVHEKNEEKTNSVSAPSETPCHRRLERAYAP
jgi:hypothetical protein